MPGFRSLGTPVPEGVALAGLARCDEVAGDPAAAQVRYEEVLRAGRAVGEPGLTATALEGLGRLAALAEDRPTAVRLVSQAADLRLSAGRPAPALERFQGWDGGVLAAGAGLTASDPSAAPGQRPSGAAGWTS